MDKYLEYNLINNIPIIYPIPGRKHFKYSPRYAIADADKLLHCFDRGKEPITIRNARFRYIRIHLNKSFKTLNNEVRALYYYIVVENSIDYDGFDVQDINKVMKWLKDTNNHYVLVTTPILQYRHIFYSVANDNNISIIEHNANELMDNCQMILKLLDNNCYTICDNYNISIALYHKHLLDKSTFRTILKMLNQLKNFYYTSALWIYLMNHHRIMLACDFPVLFFSTRPELTDEGLYELFDIYAQDTQSVYLQTCYNNYILYCSLYPLLQVKQIATDSNSIVIRDFYGMIGKHLINCDILVDNICNTSDYYAFTDIMFSIFELYNNGCEDCVIKRCRIRKIWNTILNRSPTYIETLVKHICIIRDCIIPYRFLEDVYNTLNIDWGKTCLMMDDKHIYRHCNIYSMLCKRILRDSIYYFHQNVQKRRLIFILLCIYRRFNMFSADIRNPNEKYITGCLILNYLRHNIYYLT